ncbi:MAG: NADP-dependent oxidoreductase [Steroidobacteraceae bacterium]
MISSTMRAVVFERYGPPDVLRPVEAVRPRAGEGELLIAVAAASVNPADFKWRAGMFRDLVPLQFPHILGYDVAGTVEAVGRGVCGFSPGVRVAALLDPVTKGGYAECVAVHVQAVARIPSALSFAVAAAVPCAGLTGTQVVEDSVRPAPGERVLITGATGAVGRFALAAARRLGAHVIAAVRASHVAEARALGAAQVIVLGDDDWRGAPFDQVCDTVGGPAVSRLCRHVVPGGRIFTVSTTPIDPDGLPAEPSCVAVRPDGERLAALLDEVAAGRMTVPIALRLPLEAAAEAHRLLEAGGLKGKIILDVKA